MKLLCLSDTHGLHNKIPKEWFVEADVIIHAGDCTSRGYIEEVKNFLNWFESLDYKHKIFIAGNHDWGFQDHPDLIKSILEKYPSINYLQDQELIIDNVKFYGSPWQPEFYNWAFNLRRGKKLQDKWDLIPLDADVLITHGPPYEIGDFVPGDEFVGCKDLLNTILTKLTNLKAHIFGHIHYSYGITNKDNIQFVNASNCTERYEPINKPILITI